MAFKSGKRLQGQQPRRKGRWLRQSREAMPATQPGGMFAMVMVGLFVVGIVAGFGWAGDRQLRGGLLRQQDAAMDRPDWVYLRNLPRYVPETFVAVAQPSLLTRGGLRPEGEDDGSIARDLIHQVHRLPDSLAGEARGLVMAPVLEQRVSTPELIELYLNRVYLGRSQGLPVYGLHHAALEYFDKDASQLTLSETATLAGLLLDPRIDDPHARVGAVGPRRNEVLRVMLRGGLITEDEYRGAIAEALPFQPGLDQMPFSRPATWGESAPVLRLPPTLRPVPPDSAEAEE